MLPRWKTQFFIKFFEGGIIMQEGNRGQPKEDPFHVFVPLLPLNMAQNDISDSPIPSWNVPGPWNYPETAVSRQLLLTTALWNYAKSAPKFLNMGLTPLPPPFWTMFKKTAELVTGGTPKWMDGWISDWTYSKNDDDDAGLEFAVIIDMALQLLHLASPTLKRQL